MAQRVTSGLGGGLLLLALLLLVWHPLRVALSVSVAVLALPVRGWPLAALLAVRVVVAGASIAAGIALLNRSPAAVRLTVQALLLSGATDLFIYLTSFYPNNRMPGDTPYYIAASLLYHAFWLAFVRRNASRIQGI